MISKSISRLDDRIEGDLQIDPAEIDYVIGDWYNTDAHTGQIVQVNISGSVEKLIIRAWGASTPEPIDWGSTELLPFLDRGSLHHIQGLTARWDLDFMSTEICCNIKGGILVIQTYNRFQDDSKRPNYFTKEFFHLKTDQNG